jgi:hypothetical protein
MRKRTAPHHQEKQTGSSPEKILEASTEYVGIAWK